ncbi:hypothetical protein Lnau_1299 [Legionella nautarum]|uniref:Uncharacterized protein n=1 Tax=Legionella nautarum TaxID=45070 RepID=A0A0W0WVG2_9GAMM|nr:hypothetical protein [Legionella nautarum]KTD36315.1 hypothetical protein Lnau_1299 [Legionella nautarum]
MTKEANEKKKLSKQEKKLESYHKKLVSYIRKKERLTRDNLVSFEKRTSFVGFITAFYPIIRLRDVMQNYAEKKGVLYKLFHFFSADYQAGEKVVFPSLRNFFGALFKNFITNRSNKENLIIRQNNIGYAQELLAQLDAKIYGEPELDIDINQEIYEQLKIKKARKEFDSYYYLLKEIFAKTDQQVTKRSLNELREKSTYLDNRSAEPVKKGLYRGNYHSSAMIQVKLSESEGDLCLLPVAPFSHPYIDEQIHLARVLRWGDQCMHMVISVEKYQEYSIKGVEEKSKRLVGKDNELLADGWYQFVIIHDPQTGQLFIRYYPCGEKRDGVPFIKQNPTKSEEAVDDEGYLIQHPESFSLKYEKYIAHSELAGGLPVNAAGAFMIKNGKLRVIEDSSGHYARKNRDEDPHRSLKFCFDLFSHLGADLEDTVLERWEPYHGIDKLLKKGAAVLTQFFELPSLKKEGISAQLAELRATEPEHESPIQKLVKLS